MIVICLITLSCKENVQTTENAVILRDAFGEELVLKDSAKTDLIQSMKKTRIYEKDALWLFIDSDFYKKYEFYINDTTSYVNENLLLLWFSMDEEGEKEFEKGYLEQGESFILEVDWHLAVTYDPKQNKILNVTYQF